MNETQKAVGAPSRLMPAKPFAELTSDEKIERLAEAVRNYRYVISRMVRVEGALQRLECHEHGQNGRPVVPFNSRNDEALGAMSSYDPLA